MEFLPTLSIFGNPGGDAFTVNSNNQVNVDIDTSSSCNATISITDCRKNVFVWQTLEQLMKVSTTIRYQLTSILRKQLIHSFTMFRSWCNCFCFRWRAWFSKASQVLGSYSKLIFFALLESVRWRSKTITRCESLVMHKQNKKWLNDHENKINKSFKWLNLNTNVSDSI